MLIEQMVNNAVKRDALAILVIYIMLVFQKSEVLQPDVLHI